MPSGDVICGRINGSVTRRSRRMTLRDPSLNSSQTNLWETIINSQQTTVKAASTAWSSSEGPCHQDTEQMEPLHAAGQSAERELHLGRWLRSFARLSQIHTVLARTAITNSTGLNNRYLVSHSSGGWKPKIRVPAGLVSGEDSMPGLQVATFLLCPHMAERESQRVRSQCLFFLEHHSHQEAPSS